MSDRVVLAALILCLSIFGSTSLCYVDPPKCI